MLVAVVEKSSQNAAVMFINMNKKNFHFNVITQKSNRRPLMSLLLIYQSGGFLPLYRLWGQRLSLVLW